MKNIFLLASFLYAFSGASEAWAEAIGKFPTGLLQLEKKYPYYLYVPESYSPEKVWPLLLVIGERGEEAKEVMTPWVDWAKKNQYLVLVAPNNTPQRDVPEKADEWLMAVKREVGERYRIDRNQILLVGLGSGGHYAAYLGTNYPQEFSAAALLGGSWVGPFERILRPTDNPEKQISFYLALNPEKENFSKTEAKALEFEKKGYEITFESVKADEDFSSVRERMIQWFQTDTEARLIPKEKARTTFRQKAGGFFKGFYEE